MTCKGEKITNKLKCLIERIKQPSFLTLMLHFKFTIAADDYLRELRTLKWYQFLQNVLKKNCVDKIQEVQHGKPKLNIFF